METLALGAIAVMLVAYLWSLFDKRLRGWMLSGTAAAAFGALALIQETAAFRWAWIAVAFGHVVRAVVLFRRDRQVASGAAPAETSQ